MAVYRWTGASSDVYITPGNWVNEAGTAYTSGYPGSGNALEDDVILDGVPATQMEAKDASALAKLRSLRVGSTYDDYVGSSAGNYLQVDAAEVVIEASACPGVYLHGNSSIDSIVVQDGSAVYLKGTYGAVSLFRGTIEFNTTATISTSLTIGSVTDSSDATVTIPNITSLCATVTANGGTVTCSEGFTTLYLNGAEWTQAAGDITTVYQGSGDMAWNGGNITTLHLYGGDFTAAGGGTARRIGTAYVHSNTTCTLDNGQDSIIVTNYVKSFGGTVTFGSGFNLAPYADVTYAGSSDAKLGVVPQVLNNGNVDGDAIYVGPFDLLEVYCEVGAADATSALTYKLQESDASGGSYSDISGKTATFADTDDNKTKRITLWGHERTATKPWVKLNVANAAAADAYVSAFYIKKVF